VYVAGSWRLVQCNWASMQINTKAARETRQLYQDHYFLTDPDKFIFEFFPLSAEFQFLEHPVTKSEFESLPLLRSTFFHLGLSLARSEGLLNAVVLANDMGEANIYLNSRTDTSFHYTLINSKTGATSVKAPGGKFPLDRFVLMSTTDRETTFNVHVPQKGSFILEIGAVKYPSSTD
jgi:transglutaminase/protease-like cytokinesis protein 3